MNKNLKDILIHSGVAAAMMAILLALPHPTGLTIAVCSFWYGWELGQRIVKDVQNRGVLYWWNIALWSNQARLEFLAPSLVAIVIVNIYAIIMTL